MKKKNVQLYPSVKEAEAERSRAAERFALRNDSADAFWCVGGYAPNYEKFKGWPDEKVLAWLNVD